MEDNRRLFLIVLDSVGIGEAPDAAQFGDEGSNPVRAAVEAGADLPNLRRLGLFNIDGMDYQILVEADFLVNLYEDSVPKAAAQNALDKIFKTQTGKTICKEMFVL